MRIEIFVALDPGAGVAIDDGAVDIGGGADETHDFGVYNIGFKFWPKAFDPGFRPWVGGAVGLDGAGTGITPVLLGGVSWAREKQGVMPFLAAEYATRRERMHLKLGFLLGG